MAEIKAHEFDGILKRKPLPYNLFVFYGPDRGLVSERASAVSRMCGVPLDDPFSVIKFDASDVGAQPGKIIDEMQSMGLFGGSRLVWVKGVMNEKGVIDALAMLAGQPRDDSTLIVEAGDIKKGVGVRKIAESARSIASIACYHDDRKALNALIDEELASSGLRLSPDARGVLLDSLGGDRIASRNEIRKLALYCQNLGTIDEQQVSEIIGDASATSVDDAVDAILSGDRQAFLHAAEKISQSKTPIFLVFQGCLRQFQVLDAMRSKMDGQGLSASQVLQSSGRGIHFKRKPILERALRTWTAPQIAREMNRIQAAILQSRQKQTIEESVALHTLLSTTLQSGRTS